jgi:hypothetical protein
LPLDAETIRRLTETKKRAPASKKPAQGSGGKKGSRKGYMGIRVKTQYPKLIPNDYVKSVPGTEQSSTMGCTSFGCGAPSYYLFLGQPLCSIHIVYALVHQLQYGANGATQTSEVSNQSVPPDVRPLTQLDGTSLVIINGTDESGEDDDDSYL